jgi:hypothetical protein
VRRNPRARSTSPALSECGLIGSLLRVMTMIGGFESVSGVLEQTLSYLERLRMLSTERILSIEE